jgi:hypothetical protein
MGFGPPPRRFFSLCLMVNSATGLRADLDKGHREQSEIEVVVLQTTEQIQMLLPSATQPIGHTDHQPDIQTT